MGRQLRRARRCRHLRRLRLTAHLQRRGSAPSLGTRLPRPHRHAGRGHELRHGPACALLIFRRKLRGDRPRPGPADSLLPPLRIKSEGRRQHPTRPGNRLERRHRTRHRPPSPRCRPLARHLSRPRPTVAVDPALKVAKIVSRRHPAGCRAGVSPARPGAETQPERFPKPLLPTPCSAPEVNRSALPSSPNSESAGANNSDALPESLLPPHNSPASVPRHQESTASSLPSRARDTGPHAHPQQTLAPATIPANPPAAPSLKNPSPAPVPRHSPARAHFPATRNSPAPPSLPGKPASASLCSASHSSAQNAASASEYLRAAPATEAWSASSPPAGNTDPDETLPYALLPPNRDSLPQSVARQS